MQDAATLFTVTDPKTGEIFEGDLSYEDFLAEDWALKGRLLECDIEGFAIGADGTIYLLDEVGAYAIVPKDRFVIAWKERQP